MDGRTLRIILYLALSVAVIAGFKVADGHKPDYRRVYSRIQIGMSQDEVRRIAGEPFQFRPAPDTVFFYDNDNFLRILFDGEHRQALTVEFKANRVVDVDLHQGPYDASGTHQSRTR